MRDNDLTNANKAVLMAVILKGQDLGEMTQHQMAQSFNGVEMTREVDVLSNVILDAVQNNDDIDDIENRLEYSINQLTKALTQLKKFNANVLVQQ